MLLFGQKKGKAWVPGRSLEIINLELRESARETAPGEMEVRVSASGAVRTVEINGYDAVARR